MNVTVPLTHSSVIYPPKQKSCSRKGPKLNHTTKNPQTNRFSLVTVSLAFSCSFFSPYLQALNLRHGFNTPLAWGLSIWHYQTTTTTWRVRIVRQRQRDRKKDEESVRGDDKNTTTTRKKHHCRSRVVLSSQVLHLSLAHLNKATADCQRKWKQREQERGESSWHEETRQWGTGEVRR